MSLVSDSIPTLIQGISQQADSLRAASQLQAQENCYSAPVEGLAHRPPIEHLAKVSDVPLDDAFMHTIDRTATQRYKMILTNGKVQVFDLLGNEKTVNYIDVDELDGDENTYLQTATPKTIMRAVTVADFTFVVNTDVVPAFTADLSEVRDSEALVFIKKGEYGSTYKVFIDDVERASYVTSATVVNTLTTTNIATELYNDLVASAQPNFSFTLKGSVIWVTNTASDFKIRTQDGQAGNSLQVFKGKTALFSDLPAEAPDGFLIAIDADTTTDKGQYFVRAVVNQTGETFGPVTWQEACAAGVPTTLDGMLMPHALVHNPNDTFDFKRLDWGERVCGDEDTNSDPSFVGVSINAVCFYKNRLGFLADTNFIFSEVGAGGNEYFNFFRTTVTQVKDSDPVDSRPTTTKVSILKRVIPYNKNLILFSDTTQFLIPSDTAMTPKTVRCDVVSNYEGLMDVQPQDSGKAVLFMFDRESYAGLNSLEVSQTNSDKYEAEEVTGHVPAYIPAGAFSLTVSTLSHVACMLTTGDPDSIYVYQTAYSGEKRVQNAFYRWNLADDTASEVAVLSADFIGSTLYLLVQRDGEVFLEKLRLIPKRVDPYHTYVTFLDRRITEAECDSVVYDIATNRTLITLPFDITSTSMVVVTRSVADNTPYALPGMSLTVTSAVVGQPIVYVRGDFSANPLWIGQRFLCEAELSKIYVRKAAPSGGTIVEAASNLQLLKGWVVYTNSGPFTVRVTPEARSSSDYNFTGRVVGDSNNVLGQVALRSGRFPFSILSANERVRIQFRSNSHLPFQFASVDWEGNYTKRSQGR